jgi:putative flippase GtrA
MFHTCLSWSFNAGWFEAASLWILNWLSVFYSLTIASHSGLLCAFFLHKTFTIPSNSRSRHERPTLGVYGNSLKCNECFITLIFVCKYYLHWNLLFNGAKRRLLINCLYLQQVILKYNQRRNWFFRQLKFKDTEILLEAAQESYNLTLYLFNQYVWR